MFKALKGLKKKLGSSSKLQEAAAPADIEAALPDSTAAVGAAQPPLPPAAATPLPKRAPQAVETSQDSPAGSDVQAAAPAAVPTVHVPAGLPPRHRPPSPSPLGQHQDAAHLLGHAGGELAVDYELVAGPLELDGTLPMDERVGVACDDHPHHAPECQLGAGEEHHEHDQHGWHDSAGASGEAITGGQAAAAAEGSAGVPACACPVVSPAAEGAVAAAEAAAAEGITDALATMMYLTEDPQGAEDCVSVVSDALSEEDLPDDISELSRALEALEGEALGSSPASGPGPSVLAAGGGIDDQLAERLGISPDAADPTAYSQQMAKLYNNLGLKMMERRKHEEALGLLRKAEAIVENEGMWGRHVHRRQRMQAITYNNLGCLFKRRNMPQLALQYLQKALALEELGGPVQNSSSTHLNISAAFSALKRPKEALGHAERAIILLQRHLWAHHMNFQEGLSFLVRQLAAPGAAARPLLASANVLAMAYHNAAVEHEKLGRLREALVSFTRAHMIASKCLGAKAKMTASLSKALKAFQQRQARYLPTGAAHAARKAPSLASVRSAAPAAQSKRGVGSSRSSGKLIAGSKASSKSMGSLAAAAANGKATLPLDKASKASLAVRPPSASRLASQLQQH